MNRKENRRKLRNLIVNKKQLMIVIIGSVYLFFSIVLIFMATISPVYHNIFESSELSKQRDSAKAFIILSEKLVSSLFAVFICTFMPLVWITHRIFGPLINFANIYRKISGGDLAARIYLRRGDLLQSEALLANEMILSISNSIQEIKKQNNRLIAELDGMSERKDRQNELKDDFARIRAQALICRELLSKFKTEEPPKHDVAN